MQWIFKIDSSVKAKIVMVGSEGGSLMNRFLEKQIFNKHIIKAVVKKECGFLEVAKKWNIPTAITGNVFLSRFLIENYGEKDNIFIINFSTSIFSNDFTERFLGRAFNCHPTLLPAFKGLTAIEDNFSSNSLFMGCSIHQIERKIDGGKCIIQAAIPMSFEDTFAVKRHKVFEKQLVTLLQLIRWILNGRLEIEKGVSRVSEASYETSCYAPNLDQDFFSFINFGLSEVFD